MKNICIYLAIAVAFISCQTDAQREAEKERLEEQRKKKEADKKAEREKLVENYFTLAVEKNIEFENLPIYNCTYPSTIKTNIFTVPVNKELIDAAIELKCTRENIIDVTRDSLISRNYRNFLHSNRVVFVLIVINNKLNSGETVRFDNFRAKTKLLLDNDSILALSNSTPSLEMTLKPGFNAGYIYFNGIIPSAINSYTLKTANIIQSCDTLQNSKEISFTYETTGIDILKMLENNGNNKDDIRKKYGFKPHEDSGLTLADFERVTNVISTLITIKNGVTPFFAL